MKCKTASLPPVLDSLHIGVSLHDPESGSILDVNDRLEQLHGYTKDEFRTMSIEEYTAASTKITPEVAGRRIRAAANGEPQKFELQIERKNGEYRWVNVHFTPTDINGKRYVVGQITDITEYKVREQLLRLLNRVVRHNLRNDMNILIGYADRVKTAIENDNLDEEIETILDIATEVGTLSQSLTQIEEIVKPDATQRQPTDLRDVVETHATEAESEYPDVNFTVETSSEEWVSADTSLSYAVENAIENAVEHNDSDHPEVTISVTSDPQRNLGVIRIADNGPPIPEIETEVLFNDIKVESTYHGSGVGLWLMKWCVDSLGGRLSFEENTPRGNVVRISIPEVPESAADT